MTTNATTVLVPTGAARPRSTEVEPPQPGSAAVCTGRVFHRRHRPALHEFVSRVSYVWLDPDHPETLCGPHPLWSERRIAVARFRSTDYGDGSKLALGEQVRAALTPLLGRRPTGQIRMLTQIRRWGWLFNPITAYVVWDEARPCAAVLEVTNTPWKERTVYPLELAADGDPGACRFVGSTRKTMHVSPFLDEAFDYAIALAFPAPDRIELSIDVMPLGGEATSPIVSTHLAVRRQPVSRRVLTRTLLTPAPTHRVTFGIHWHALRLAIKRVPFVPHPKRRSR
jgi:DUF1365 family protein